MNVYVTQLNNLTLVTESAVYATTHIGRSMVMELLRADNGLA